MAFKACPFCASDDTSIKVDQRTGTTFSYLYPYCLNCGAQGSKISIKRFKDEDDNWRRFTQDEVAALKRKKEVIQACEKQWNRRDG